MVDGRWSMVDGGGAVVLSTPNPTHPPPSTRGAYDHHGELAREAHVAFHHEGALGLGTRRVGDTAQGGDGGRDVVGTAQHAVAVAVVAVAAALEQQRPAELTRGAQDIRGVLDGHERRDRQPRAVKPRLLVQLVLRGGERGRVGDDDHAEFLQQVERPRGHEFVLKGDDRSDGGEAAQRRFVIPGAYDLMAA